MKNNFLNKLILKAMIFGGTVFCVLVFLAYAALPPEDYKYYRKNFFEGIYSCCENGPRSSASWIGTHYLDCNISGYYAGTGSRFADCGFRDQLKDKRIYVEEINLPVFLSKEGRNVVIKMSSSDHIYKTLEVNYIRRAWFYGSVFGAFLYVFFMSSIYIVFCLILNSFKKES